MDESYTDDLSQDTAAEDAPDYSWVPFFEELASKLLEYEGKQNELIKMLRAAGVKAGLTDRNEKDEEIPLQEIDPFSFFSQITKYGDTEKRRIILRHLKNALYLRSKIPSEFSGVPKANAIQSWFFRFKKERNKDDIPKLWKLFKQAIKDNIEPKVFNEALELKLVGKPKLTQALFWVAPKIYLPIDVHTKKLLRNINIAPDFDNYQEYKFILKEVRAKVSEKPFYKMSHEAWQLSKREKPLVKFAQDKVATSPSARIRYWLFAPGPAAKFWEEFYREGIIAIGWDDLGDLRKYSSKKEIVQKLREIEGDLKSSKKNNATSCFSFAVDMQIGDIVLAKKGRRKIIGYGKVESDYMYDNNRLYFKHIRKVRWINRGEWNLAESDRVTVKTLTNITKYGDFISRVRDLVGIEEGAGIVQEVEQPQYWWMPANPRIWSWADAKVGELQLYTSYNEKGRKRRIYENYLKAKPGDIVIGYVGTPVRAIAAVAEITKGMHNSKEGEAIEFKVKRHLNNPINLERLRNIPELENCEPFENNNQGSLFRLSPREYQVIEQIIEKANPDVLLEDYEKYTTEEAVQELFMSEEKYRDIVDLLSYRQALILQGPPGVGKTYIAKRIAYSIIGKKDTNRVQMIQFHQSYSYEDFIQGYRPNEHGQFYIKNGVFYIFCKLAQQDPDNKYFFIIDEINRGNLSKIEILSNVVYGKVRRLSFPCTRHR